LFGCLPVHSRRGHDRIKLFEGSPRAADEADLLVIVADIAILKQEIAQHGRRRVRGHAIAID
jgi:hypothetical protein